MFYGSSASMSLPSKNKLKRQSRTFTQVLYRTLSYRDRRSVADIPNQVADDPAELSTQTSAPGVLKIFGDEICAGANYKSVLATPRSSAQELVKEALERYSLSKAAASEYLLCDVIGKFEGAEKKWRTECLRALGDNEKPLLLQDLWKPKEGFARRFELRKRADVEEMASKEIDTITAGSRGSAGANPGQGANPPQDSIEVSSNYLTYFWYFINCGILLIFAINIFYCVQLQDCLVYLLNRDQHTVGQETSSARPNICLSSPDILPLHCKIKKIQVLKRLSQTVEERLVMEPLPHASILINFSKAEHTTPLRHGDLLSFGAHYIFLYKDPVSAKPLPAQTLARLKALSQLPDGEVDQIAPFACKVCGAVIKEKQQLRKGFKTNLNKSKNLQRRKLHLEFEKVHEDELIGRIISLIEPGGDDHKLTPAYLLCLCIKHSATAFEAGTIPLILGKCNLEHVVGEYEGMHLNIYLQSKYIKHYDLCVLKPFNTSAFIIMLILIFIFLFIGFKCILFLLLGSKESLLSTTISANEEAMTILEEVIMYTFQQCVYYITKSLYVCLPGLLECNPFLTEATDSSWRSSASVPEAVRKVVLIYQTTLDLLQQYEVHMEVQSQMFAYLFFFTNVSLFNQLLDKGPMRGWFQWSRGIQIQGTLRMLADWARNAGLSHLADDFFAKFSATANILATPMLQLIQMSWKCLCTEYPSLTPAQIHHLLAHYQLSSDIGPIPAWHPNPDEEAQIYRTGDLLESFENHPPIVLPSSGFKVNLESDCVDDNIYRQLLYVRHFLWGIKTRASPSNGNSDMQELPVGTTGTWLFCPIQ
uniref:Ras association and DIL domains n=1 Tax=Erpetoichthys calabaricus TaxID=27687 RepID=A0A8C4T923_ERPCA